MMDSNISAHISLNRMGNPPVFHEGEHLKMGIKPSENTYLYLLNSHPEKQIDLLFPNERFPENFAPANRMFYFPAAEGPGYKVVGPGGIVLLWLIGTREQFDFDVYPREEAVEMLLNQGIIAKGVIYVAD
jgi:hypothetical protein